MNVLLYLTLMCNGFFLTTNCTQSFALLAKTDRVLWIALDVNGECYYSHLLQLIITDSTVLEVPPTQLTKFSDWEEIKRGIKHFHIDILIRLESSNGSWIAPEQSWTLQAAESNPQLFAQYNKFHRQFANDNGRLWNQTMGTAGVDLPIFTDIEMELIYAFPAGLYVNYQIAEAIFFEGYGQLLVFTRQKVLANSMNTMHGFLLFRKTR